MTSIALFSAFASSRLRCSTAASRLSRLSDGGACRRRNSRRRRMSRGHTTRRRCMTAWRQAGCRLRMRRKRITSWKALPSRNAGIWCPSICWNGPIAHCPARTCRNETRKSAWEQNNGLLRNLKPCFRAVSSSSSALQWHSDREITPNAPVNRSTKPEPSRETRTLSVRRQNLGLRRSQVRQSIQHQVADKQKCA